jgi:hypothetical protein
MFFLLFLPDDRRIRIRIHISNYWIRMRIREAQKHMDATDPDPHPQHCYELYTKPVKTTFRIWCPNS